jgi:MFS family permease
MSGEYPHGFSALYSRDFRLFLMGQVISLSGTWMHSVAQGWLVYSLTKSPLYLGLVASCATLPILLFTLLGGSLADRYPRRNIVIVTQTLSIVPALLLGILTYFDIVEVWHVALLAFFFGTLNAFDVPARQALIPDLAGLKNITSAIALNSAAFNGARVLGPLMAGLLIAGFSMPVCFFLNALSFVPVIIALLRIKAVKKTTATAGGFLAGMGAGGRFVLKEKKTLYILTLIAVLSLFGMPYVTMMPVIAEEVLNEGVTGLSMLISTAGAGSLFAAFFIAYREDIGDKGAALPMATNIFALAFMGLSFSHNYYLSLFFVFFAGCGIVGFLALSNSFIQHAVSDALRGRVMSLHTLVFLGFAPLGNSAIGFAAHIFGTLESLRLFAAVCIISSLVFAYLFTKHGGRREHENTCC